MMFERQRSEEKVVFTKRKHPAVLFKPALYLTLLTLLPIFAFIYFKFSWVFSLAFFFWLIFAGFLAFQAFYCFLNSQYILTSQRLIKMEQKGLFHKTISEAPLEKIRDVSLEVKGFWPSMFDFGTIYIQIAEAPEKIVLECLEEPRKVQERILEEIKGVEEIEEVKEEKKPKVKKIKKTPPSDFWD